ncbi:MAG: hypothetical protein IJ381_10330 [Clostridia bacterium]|nr:hypothetical protein [Clostridia bacterium]
MVQRIKRVFLLMITLLCTSACAAEEEKLPQAVIDLCIAVHPGYEIAAHDGWGDENGGQFALILKQGADNILCMAEKGEGDSAYGLTIDNTNAVYDGDVLPGLLIDTGGDSLWFTYYDAADGSSVHYGSIKSDGQWGQVSTLSYWPKEDGLTGMMAWVSDGMLQYEETDEDENENVRNWWTYMPIWVGPEYKQSLELTNFNINTFDADPRDGLYPLIKNEAFTRSQSAAGVMIRDMDISRVHAARLFETEDEASLLQVDDWDGTFSHTAVMLRFADGAVMDTYHAGAGQVFVDSGAMMYSIKRVDEGCWVLHGVDAESGVRVIGPDYTAPDGQTTIYRNDGYFYGASPWSSLKQVEAALASSYEEMAAQMDQSAYALVNNPNPADRLHLRAKPDKGAYSYGKFYNRTPVLVLERGETWTKVQIGRGGAAMTGYMMTKYLAFNEAEKEALQCAFPQMDLREGYRTVGVRMCAEPRSSAVTKRLFKQESNDFIIGVSGDEWYVVLRADGAVGYVLQEAFWAGNG